MNIVIRGKNCTVGEELREYAEKKLRSLNRYSSQIFDANVEFQVVSKKKEEVKAEITLHVPKTILRAEEKNATLRAGFDVALARLKKRLLRLQKKKRSRQREKQGSFPTESDLSIPVVPLAKVKSFPVEKMTAEEAAFHLTNIEHDFYIFENARDRQVNVIYKRKDGSIGLLQPLVRS